MFVLHEIMEIFCKMTFMLTIPVSSLTTIALIISYNKGFLCLMISYYQSIYCYNNKLLYSTVAMVNVM